MTTRTGDASEHMPNMWQLMGEGSEMGVSALLKENEELRERCKMLSQAHSEHMKDMQKFQIALCESLQRFDGLSSPVVGNTTQQH